MRCHTSSVFQPSHIVLEITLALKKYSHHPWASYLCALLIIFFSWLSFFQLLQPITLGFIEAMLIACAWLSRLIGHGTRSNWRILTLLLGAVSAMLTVSFMNPLLFIYIPNLVINMGIAIFCFSTLAPNHEPIITRIARLIRGNLTDDIKAYTRRVTWIWAWFSLALVVESTLLLRFAPIEITLIFFNFIHYALITALFLLEHAYRKFRFPHDSHITPLQLAVKLTSSGWSAMKGEPRLPRQTTKVKTP